MRVMAAVKRLSLSWLAGFVVVTASSRATVAQEVIGYGCFSQPVDFGDIDEYENPGPLYAVHCPGPPDPLCTRPAAPTVHSILVTGTFDTFLANEARVVALIPPEDGSLFTEEMVWAQYRPDPGAPYANLWHDGSRNDVTSYDTVRTDFRMGNNALFDATGLVEGKMHRFRVAFCRTAATGERGCTCWSDWAEWQGPTAFPPRPTAPPASTVQLVEDDFDRRDSRPATGRSPAASRATGSASRRGCRTGGGPGAVD